VRSPRRRAALLPALLVSGVVVAACAAATPTRSPASHDEPPSDAPSAGAPTLASERPSPPGLNALELDIGQIDPAWVWPMLDFGSDSYAVIWSSGVLDGPVGNNVPDLWRYVPGQPEPELLWRNPHRDRQLPKVAGDTDVWAFAETSSLGERWWNLWLLTEPGGEPILLDSHPGDENIPSLVPSFDVDAGRIAWTSFDRAPDGAVSQIWMAEAPDWEPHLLGEAAASERAFWLPSLRGERLAYVEVTIGADPSEDVRHVLLADLATPGADPTQLDSSGNATMPVLADDAVIWKEPDKGFAMFNWGRLYGYAFETGEITPLRIAPQDYVNYPSGGGRFVAMWGADSSTFAVRDLELGANRLIARFDNQVDAIMRPHLAGDLLVWLHLRTDGPGDGPRAPIEYAWLPEPGSDRATTER